MGRILAIDYGTKRTGIAVSDPLRLIAGGLETVPTTDLERWLAAYFAREEVSTIVCGNPSHLAGTPSDPRPLLAPPARLLPRSCPATGGVFLVAGVTSVLAHRAMLDGGLGRMARRDRALVDKISATIILQGYMEYESNR